MRTVAVEKRRVVRFHVLRVRRKESKHETDGFVMAGEVADENVAAGLVVRALSRHVPRNHRREGIERSVLDKRIAHLHLRVHAENENAWR